MEISSVEAEQDHSDQHAADDLNAVKMDATELLETCRLGHVEDARGLLAAGVDIEQQDGNRSTLCILRPSTDTSLWSNCCWAMGHTWTS